METGSTRPRGLSVFGGLLGTYKAYVANLDHYREI